ncbi:putative transporter [Methanolinea mesophila]|uniref:hypothetical protein n=1 Tax=Methanolinea mesophila TaxID=547055 RepID=UPI001AE34067|nr:hypothetical protein [Methanolinea mesophila]MBP1928696.1 putative transporter [Methanolinea mesophila]
MEKEKRKTWIGVIMGAIIIGAGFYIGILLHRPGNDLLLVVYSALIFMAGGLFSGIYTSCKVWDGIWYGLLSGIIGAFFIMIPILAMLVSDAINGLPAGFAAGMALFLGIFVSLAAIVLAAAGGAFGVLAKRAWYKESIETQENSTE